jgi:hypothetical protein
MSYDGYASDPNVINLEEARGMRKEAGDCFNKSNDDEYHYSGYPSVDEEEQEYLDYITSVGIADRSRDRAMERMASMQHILFLMSLMNTLILFYLWFISLS